ncbi:MAG: hypothetical protein PVH45_05425, partial [Candidatus Omnitrophota bacterium]
MKYKLLVILIAITLAMAMTARAEDVNILHRFNISPDDGQNPYGDLTLGPGGVLYGMTRKGGVHNYGTIFSIGADGEGFSIMHDFERYTNDNGAYPHGSLILDSGMLYGMTSSGGTERDNNGTIFSIGTDGSDFTLLHRFSRLDGTQPYGSLSLDSGTFYGMTSYGGAEWAGSVFSIETDGTGFDNIYDFGYGYDDGAYPWGDLVVDSGRLYGMTSGGGYDDSGVVFSMNTDGTDHNLLYEFEYGLGADNTGNRPYGGLLLDSGVLYGMTSQGGAEGRGTIFSIGVGGEDFTVMHHFGGAAGIEPKGSLILANGVLYGMASNGALGRGTIFSVGTDGSDFTVLSDFSNDGRWPYGSLIYDSGMLYGTTSRGGYNESGVIFSLQVGPFG